MPYSPTTNPLIMRCLFVFIVAFYLLSCSSISSKEPITLSGIAYNSMAWAVKIDILPPNVSQPQLQQELQRLRNICQHIDQHGLNAEINRELLEWKDDPEVQQAQ